MTPLHWQTGLQNRQCHVLCTLGETSVYSASDQFVYGTHRDKRNNHEIEGFINTAAGIKTFLSDGVVIYSASSLFRTFCFQTKGFLESN